MDEIKPSLEQILESVGEVGDSILKQIKGMYHSGKDIPYYHELFGYCLNKILQNKTNKDKDNELFNELGRLNLGLHNLFFDLKNENKNTINKTLSMIYFYIENTNTIPKCFNTYMDIINIYESNDETNYIIQYFKKTGFFSIKHINLYNDRYFNKYKDSHFNKYLNHRKKLGNYSKHFEKKLAEIIKEGFNSEEINNFIKFSKDVKNKLLGTDEPFAELEYKIQILKYSENKEECYNKYFLLNKEITNQNKFLKDELILDSIYQSFELSGNIYNLLNIKEFLPNSMEININYLNENKTKKISIIKPLEDFENLLNEGYYQKKDFRNKLINNKPELFFSIYKDDYFSYEAITKIGAYLINTYTDNGKYEQILKNIKIIKNNGYITILNNLFLNKNNFFSDISDSIDLISNIIKQKKDTQSLFQNIVSLNSQYMNNVKEILNKDLSKEEIAEIPLYDLKGEILRKIGEGTRSKVYALKNENEDTILAMKVPKDNKAEEKYKQEQKILDIFRRFPHENIVKFYYAGDDYVKIKDKPIYVIIQEYLEGKTIKDMLETYFIGLPDEQAKDVSMQLLGTINHLKEHNVFHMDLHLDNIIYNENKIKIFDFERATDKFGEMPNFNRRTGGDSDYFSWGIMVPQIFSNKHPIYEKKPGQSSNSFADIVYKLKKEIRDEEGKLKQKYKDRIKKLVSKEFYKPVIASLEYNGIGEVPKEITDFYNKKTYEKEKYNLKEILGIEVSYEQYKKLKELK